MATLLEKAIKKLVDLPKKRQDSYASIIFDELDSETQWDNLFARTSDKQIKKIEHMVRDDMKKGATSFASSREPNDRTYNWKIRAAILSITSADTETRAEVFIYVVK